MLCAAETGLLCSCRFVRNFVPLPMSYKAVAVTFENTMKLANFVPSQERESDALPPHSEGGGATACYSSV